MGGFQHEKCCIQQAPQILCIHQSIYYLLSVDLLLGPQPGVELPLGTAEADADGGPEAGRGG